MKLRNLISALPVFQSLYLEKLPVKTAFKLYTISQAIQPILAAYDSVRIPLVKQYTDEKGVFDQTKTDELIKQLDPLLDEDIEFKTPTLTLNELENVKLSPLSLEAIAWLIKE